MNRTLGPATVSTIKNTDIVFDANVWIFVMAYCNADAGKTAEYSKIQSDLIKSDCNIIAVKEIVFEVFNRCIKFEFDLCCNHDANLKNKFKQYRSSSEFRPTMEGIRDTCLHIIDDNKFVSTAHNKLEMSNFINEAGDGLMDSTDLVVEKYCRENGIFFATDDRDFIPCPIDIITANRSILKARPNAF